MADPSLAGSDPSLTAGSPFRLPPDDSSGSPLTTADQNDTSPDASTPVRIAARQLRTENEELRRRLALFAAELALTRREAEAETAFKLREELDHREEELRAEVEAVAQRQRLAEREEREELSEALRQSERARITAEGEVVAWRRCVDVIETEAARRMDEVREAHWREIEEERSRTAMLRAAAGMLGDGGHGWRLAAWGSLAGRARSLGHESSKWSMVRCRSSWTGFRRSCTIARSIPVSATTPTIPACASGPTRQT